MAKEVNLTEELKRNFGFDTFKGNQEAIIRNLLAGNDTFVLMPTGGGKSLCYQLPSLILDGTAIVISAFDCIDEESGRCYAEFQCRRWCRSFHKLLFEQNCDRPSKNRYFIGENQIVICCS